MTTGLTEDKWLSALLGKPAYHWSGPWAETAQALDTLKEQAFEFFCDAKVLSDDVEGARELQRLGFFMADTNLYFQAQPQAAPAGGKGSWSIRPARKKDAAAVGRIAELGFEFSRFHRDHIIAREQANAIKRAWALNYFDGKRGDLMLVAENAGKVKGFLLLIQKEQGLWVIDLICVDASARGKGAGSALITAMSEFCPGVKTVGVGTQAANSAASAFYEKLGFELKKVTYVFHCHGGHL